MNDLKVNKKQKNFGLQILRSIACIFIFLSHYNAFHHLTGYFDAGGFGVSIFIVLSGFLKIVYVKNNNSNEQFEASLIYNFLRKTVTKFKKIYPLHIFTMLLAIPFEFTMIIAGEVSVFHLIFSLFLNLFMIQSFIPLGSYYFSLNAVSWYLSLVLIFTLAGDLLVIICNIIHKKVKTFGAIIFWISLQIILTLIFQFNSHFHWLLYINPFTRCIDFALGITIGVAFRNSYNRTKSNGLLLVYAGISLLLTILGIIISHVAMKTKYEAWSLAVCFTPASLMLVLTFALYAIQVCTPPRYIIEPIIKFSDITMEFFLLHQLLCRYICSFLKQVNLFVFTTSNLLAGMFVTFSAFLLICFLSKLWEIVFKKIDFCSLKRTKTRKIL